MLMYKKSQNCQESCYLPNLSISKFDIERKLLHLKQNTSVHHRGVFCLAFANYTGVTIVACGPFGPSSMLNSTSCPSTSFRKPVL